MPGVQERAVYYQTCKVALSPDDASCQRHQLYGPHCGSGLQNDHDRAVPRIAGNLPLCRYVVLPSAKAGGGSMSLTFCPTGNASYILPHQRRTLLTSYVLHQQQLNPIQSAVASPANAHHAKAYPDVQCRMASGEKDCQLPKLQRDHWSGYQTPYESVATVHPAIAQQDCRGKQSSSDADRHASVVP